MNADVNSEILEKVEYLRSKADVSYEEALSMLERFDGDLTRVLIELERANRIRRAAPHVYYDACARKGHDGAQYGGFGTDKAMPRRRGNLIEKVMRILFHNNLEVTRNDETVMNMPVACYLIFLMFAPHLTIVGVIAMLLFGCHIGVKKHARAITQQDVAHFARNAAENVHNTINNISDNIRKGFDSAGKEDEGGAGGSGEGGEFTVD
ncbi:MAG: DUF4342 domain-containing protein [Oscillospiraceae bacterium]|jgi:hypothetical protein|nr:DUF4342 domain-containing protein [Oscillospiraceae bacterium]